MSSDAGIAQMIPNIFWVTEIVRDTLAAIAILVDKSRSAFCGTHNDLKGEGDSDIIHRAYQKWNIAVI